MTKVSASTLARQAAKTTNKAEAKRLRAKAAKLRREERKAKKPRPAEKIMCGLKQAVQHAENRIGAELNQAIYGDGRTAASVDHAPLVSKPWYENEDTIADLMKMAKKPDEFRRRLESVTSAARTEARAVAQKEGMEAVSENSKAWQISIVSAFLAKCETLEQVHRGMPKTAVIDGLTLARIVDALRDAGYTSEGKTGRPQWRAVGR